MKAGPAPSVTGVRTADFEFVVLDVCGCGRLMSMVENLALISGNARFNRWHMSGVWGLLRTDSGSIAAADGCLSAALGGTEVGTAVEARRPNPGESRDALHGPLTAWANPVTVPRAGRYGEAAFRVGGELVVEPRSVAGVTGANI